MYKIENLKCGYKATGLVLEVPELSIDVGEMVVVLGKSGFGKSTLLETLALMNKSYMDGTVFFSPPSTPGDPIALHNLWLNSGMKKFADIRCRHFSFIFQQTNLMPNFTVYENIYLTRMMQGYAQKDCASLTRIVLTKLGMQGVDANKNVTELSGGQRQRVAFARAVISSFDVLFGDEPTGNLDAFNSIELLELLRQTLFNNSSPHPKTAILVSHSIELAVRFADSIIVISHDKERNCGVILPENKFRKKQERGQRVWENLTAQIPDKDFVEYLKGRFYLEQD